MCLFPISSHLPISTRTRIWFYWYLWNVLTWQEITQWIITVYVIYLIMVHNIQQILLKAMCSAVVVPHSPIEISFGGSSCYKWNKIIILWHCSFAKWIVWKTSLVQFWTKSSVMYHHHPWFSVGKYKILLSELCLPLSDSSVNHVIPSSRRVPLVIFFMSRATPFVPTFILENITTFYIKFLISNTYQLPCNRDIQLQ